jgi:glycosyltransferase involved in cell wall biosynthesis
VPNFPKGKVFEGYRNRLWQTETVDGIRVIRVWSYITANEGFAKRTLDYMSFMATGFVASLFVRRVDVVIGTSPQFFTVCAAYVTSLCKRIPWVFELRDLWPESIRAVGAMGNSKMLDRLERLELFLYRKADQIVTVTESFKRSLISRGVSSTKITVVTNGVDASKFSPRSKDQDLIKRFGLQGKFVAGYIGTHGMAHSLETILDAAELLKGLPDGDRFQFVLLGEGANKASLKQSSAERGLNNVTFIDPVSKQEIARYWSLLDVAVIHLKKIELFTTVIPSKLFECMAMGIPVLHGVQGESAEIVESEGVGLLFEPENAQALYHQLLTLKDGQTLYQRMQARGPASAAKYDRTVLAGDMLAVIESASGGHS